MQKTTPPAWKICKSNYIKGEYRYSNAVIEQPYVIASEM
jgi:hypothetical protein